MHVFEDCVCYFYTLLCAFRSPSDTLQFRIASVFHYVWIYFHSTGEACLGLMIFFIRPLPSGFCLCVTSKLLPRCAQGNSQAGFARNLTFSTLSYSPRTPCGLCTVCLCCTAWVLVVCLLHACCVLEWWQFHLLLLGDGLFCRLIAFVFDFSSDIAGVLFRRLTSKS